MARVGEKRIDDDARRVGPDTVVMSDLPVRTVNKFFVVRVQIPIDAALAVCREQILI